MGKSVDAIGDAYPLEEEYPGVGLYGSCHRPGVIASMGTGTAAEDRLYCERGCLS